MCEPQSTSSGEPDFAAFTVALRRWLADAPFLDPALAAATEFVYERRTGWFECEVTQAAWNAEDMHSAFGAAVVLSLWNGMKAGSFRLPASAWDARWSLPPQD
jgi:hypothetical protein